MDRNKVRELSSIISSILAEASDKLKAYGVVAEVGSGSFTDSNVTFKVNVSEVGENGEAKSREAESFKTNASLYGLDPSDLGKTFVDRGNNYTVLGLAPRRSKYPVLAVRGDGKKFKFRVETVRLALQLASV